MHDHEHEHDHEHDHHHHELPQPKNADELLHILGYMHKHNESHTDELDKLVSTAEELGLPEAVVVTLLDAYGRYKEGNSLLGDALDKIRKESSV